MADFISYELLPAVFNMSVTAGVVILFVLLVRLALKRAPKIYSYVLWAVVLFRLLCPVSVAAGFSLLGLLDAPTAAASAYTTVVEYVPQDVVHTPFPKVQLPVPAVSEGINGALPQGEEQTAADPLEAPMAVATAAYLAGIAAMAAYSAVSCLRLRRTLAEAVLLRDNIYLADRIESPFVMGLLRPKIYLPSALPERERAYILLHEQHHIRRLDHLFKALAFAALCVHWFNPLVWLAFVLAGKDMEMSCDEAVVRTLGEEIRPDYSSSLLSLATGRRIIAGTPLAFGEGDPKSRIRNLLNWKRPRVWITVAAAAVCVAAVAACAANPQEKPDGSAAMAGQYADMEEFARKTMERAKTVPYFSASGGEMTANVTDTRIAWLDKQGEVAGLAPEGTLEAWVFHYLVQVDAEPDRILLAGGMYEEDGWYDLEGQGGHNVVALRYPDGSCDILYDAIVNDNLDFYGYHNSYEEAVYDWYVTEKGLDRPLYVTAWDVGDLGSVPVRRFDGNGWYIYIPVSDWERAEPAGDREGRVWGWASAYGTGAGLIVDRFGPEETPSLRGNNSHVRPLDSENRIWEQTGDDYVRAYFTDTPDGGCWRVSVLLPPGSVRDPRELELLYAMAESFTVDSRVQGAAKSQLTAEELAWFNEWLDPIALDKRGNAIGVNPRCCFLTSYYIDVGDMNFEEFMRYFPGDGSQVTEAEFEALREAEGWPFGEVESLEKMPVPVHKYPRRLVELILGEYAGVTAEELNTEGVAYLPEYDAYYNYTSDAGFGMFSCTRGEREGSWIRLYDESGGEDGTRMLILRRNGDGNYQIVSHQRLKSRAE